MDLQKLLKTKQLFFGIVKYFWVQILSFFKKMLAIFFKLLFNLKKKCYSDYALLYNIHSLKKLLKSVNYSPSSSNLNTQKLF